MTLREVVERVGLPVFIEFIQEGVVKEVTVDLYNSEGEYFTIEFEEGSPETFRYKKLSFPKDLSIDYYQGLMERGGGHHLLCNCQHAGCHKEDK